MPNVFAVQTEEGFVARYKDCLSNMRTQLREELQHKDSLPQGKSSLPVPSKKCYLCDVFKYETDFSFQAQRFQHKTKSLYW
jgi:hypothetical protein